MKVLKQISGEHIMVRRDSYRAYMGSGNYVYAKFESLLENGIVNFQGFISSEKPIIDSSGSITISRGHSEWFGFSVPHESIEHIEDIYGYSLIENLNNKALEAVKVYLKDFNELEFLEETIN